MLLRLPIQNIPWILQLQNFFHRRLRLVKHATPRPKDLVGGKFVPVTVQGNCSHSVYAGPEFEFVVQFRLKSLVLKSEIMTLAREIYGFLAPKYGQLGEDGKELLFIYVMNRIPSISYLDFNHIS